MTKNNNPYYISNEIRKPVEIVYELESKEPTTPEERTQIINDFGERRDLIINKSKLSPAARNKIVKRHGADYLSERAFNHDIALTQMYGPGWGWWDDIKDVVKPVAKGALIVATFFPPTAPIAAPAAAGVILAGAAAKGIGHAADKDGWKEFGSDLLDVAGDTVSVQQASGDAGITKKVWPST